MPWITQNVIVFHLSVPKIVTVSKDTGARKQNHGAEQGERPSLLRSRNKQGERSLLPHGLCSRQRPCSGVFLTLSFVSRSHLGLAQGEFQDSLSAAAMERPCRSEGRAAPAQLPCLAGCCQEEGKSLGEF